jgi:hypothetical protein
MPLVEMKTTYYHSALDNPSHGQHETSSSSLSLTAVRANIERGDLKDRPQEVKETLLLPRKCLFASERHLCPQAMQK